ELPGGFRRIRFQTTPKMSSYLLFLGMGDFEPLEATAGSTKVRVMARRGSASKGKFALESAVQLLAFYNEYFRRALSAAQARPDRGPGRRRLLRDGELGCDPLFRAGAAGRSRVVARIRETACVRRSRPRDGSPMVRQLGDHGMVGQSLAQRRFRIL